MTQEPKSLRRKTTDGMFWNTLERVFSKGVQFVFSVLIARILVPEDYGIIAIANFFISISDIFVDSGFSRALIRKKERDEQDYNSVFYFNIAVAALLYLLLWFLAPLIAGYYANPSLTGIIRAISTVLIINALGAIQALIMNVTLNFRPIAFSAVVSMIVSGLVAWLLAWRGYGVWALVAQTVVMAIVRTGMLWGLVRWHPALLFSWKRLKELFSFGSKLLASDLLERIYNGIFTLSIGKAFSTNALGFYAKADAFASLPSNLVSGPVKTVTYPAMNGIQDDKARLGESLCQMIGLLSFVIFPLMAGLSVVARPLIAILLTEKWLEMVPLMRLLCLSYLFITLTALLQNVLLIRGRSGTYFWIQLISRALGLAFLFVAIRHSILWVCSGIAAISALLFIAYAIAVVKELGSGILPLVKSLFPAVVFTALMAAAVLALMQVLSSDWLQLIAGTLCGVIVYFGLAIVTDAGPYQLMRSLARPYWNRLTRKP